MLSAVVQFRLQKMHTQCSIQIFAACHKQGAAKHSNQQNISRSQLQMLNNRYRTLLADNILSTATQHAAHPLLKLSKAALLITYAPNRATLAPDLRNKQHLRPATAVAYCFPQTALCPPFFHAAFWHATLQ